MGEHNLGEGKNTAYEEDIRVPLFVRGPGVPAGERRSQMVLNTDIAPTLVALAGGVAPAKVEGRSIVPLLGAAPPANSAWRQSVLVTYKSGTPPPVATTTPAATAQYGCVTGATPLTKIPEYWAARTQRYTYVEYGNGDRELYDNQVDPLQLRNIYCSAAADLRTSLSTAITRLRACSGATCQAAENTAVP
jgi:hypothetical protein